MNPKLKNILLNNWSLTFVLGFLVILFFNPVKNKFLTELVSVETTQLQGDREYYNDLNYDGNSEKIVFGVNQAGNGCIKIYTPNHLGQFDSQNELIDNCHYLFIVDTNKDSLKEIYFAGVRNDSVFINQIDYANLNHAKEFFISKIKSNSAIGIAHLTSADLDNNGVEEIVFEINAGIDLQPRKIYALNLVNENVLKTPLNGAKVDPEIIEDMDHDGYPEIMCGTFATGNYKDKGISVPYSDTASWVMIFDHNLNFKTKPVYIFNKKTNTHIRRIETKNSSYLLATLNIKDSLKLSPKYRIIDASGNIVHSDSILLDEFPTREFELVTIERHSKKITDILLMTFDGCLYKLDVNFRPVLAGKLKNIQYPKLITRIDLTNDGKDEQIYKLGATDEFIFIDPTINHIFHIHLSGMVSGMRHFGIIEKKGGLPLFYYQTGDKVFKISYKQNPLWNFRFIIWALIFIGTYFFLRLMQAIQKQRIKAQLQTQHQIREMQFKIVSSQLNPHFTFNTLSSISSALYDQEKPELYDLFVKFTRLVRATMSDANKVARTLKDELEFTESYLEIQKCRFKNIFAYNVEIEKNEYLKFKVPKMIIQLFAENSIKHGFNGLDKSGHIDINISGCGQYLLIEVSDNGIGRKKAKEKKYVSSGLGIQVMNEYIDLLNRRNKQKIKLKIIDLIDGNEAVGTKVLITIPFDFNFEVAV